MTDFKLTKKGLFRLVLLFILILLLVFVVLGIYAIVYQLTEFPKLIGTDSVNALDLFEKTFGLAASLVIALVAVALAFSSLNMSKAQTILAKEQARIEHEARILRASYEAPETARSAVNRAEEALQAASDVMCAVTSMNASVATASRLNRDAEITYADMHYDVEDLLEIGAFKKEQDQIIEKARQDCWLETKKVLQVCRQVVGLIARHDDDEERELALKRHFGNFFEILPDILDRRAHFLSDNSHDDFDWIERILEQDTLQRKNISMLGYLTSLEPKEYKFFKTTMVTGDWRQNDSAIVTDLRSDIATGRFIDLRGALTEMARHCPIYSASLDNDGDVKIHFVTALIATVIDLANPYRLIGKVQKRFDPDEAPPIEGEESLHRARVEAITRYIHNQLPYAEVIFNQSGADIETGKFVKVTAMICTGYEHDGDGYEYPTYSENKHSVYP